MDGLNSPIKVRSTRLKNKKCLKQRHEERVKIKGYQANSNKTKAKVAMLYHTKYIRSQNIQQDKKDEK